MGVAGAGLRTSASAEVGDGLPRLRPLAGVVDEDDARVHLLGVAVHHVVHLRDLPVAVLVHVGGQGPVERVHDDDVHVPALQLAEALRELLEVLLASPLRVEVEREQVGRIDGHPVCLDHPAEAVGERLGVKLVVHDEHRPLPAGEAEPAAARDDGVGQLQHQPGLACLRRGDDVHHLPSAEDAADEHLLWVREVAEHLKRGEVPLPLRELDGLLLPRDGQCLPLCPEAVPRQGG